MKKKKESRINLKTLHHRKTNMWISASMPVHACMHLCLDTSVSIHIMHVYVFLTACGCVGMDVEAGVGMHVGGDEFVCVPQRERERERERETC